MDTVELESLKQKIESSSNLVLNGIQPQNGLITVSIDDDTFKEQINIAKDYLLKGDIFQVVLSRTFSRPYTNDYLDLYRSLRQMNPSPYHFLLNWEELATVGASPEKLVSLKDGVMETVPIAGTRPIGSHSDYPTIERELLDDEKENAEHMMLVDLARNDLGIVSEPGSIAVRNLKTIRRFSKIIHIVSEVIGTLRKGLTALDALKATFPAGTLTGAPKIRAMEIIDELELFPRVLYGGALCIFDAKGNMESWLAIRTAIIKDGVASVQAGAGVVYDSDPMKECLESFHKASTVLAAMGKL